jgi:hemerythrin-like domain-containing protein
MPTERDPDRRTLLRGAALTSGGLLLTGLTGPVSADPAAQSPPTSRKEEAAEEISPAEDLMREHGVLRRVLLIYDEVARRIQANGEIPPDALGEAARIIRSFIQDYHEKLEEDFLFPRFRKAGRLVDLVDVLLEQHRAGRWVTDAILRMSPPPPRENAEQRHRLDESLRQFTRMYRPHAAREDTVLFPALRSIISDSEYDALGESFEKKEHELFGAEGFERTTARVAAVEQSLGIYDLAQFTPRE